MSSCRVRVDVTLELRLEYLSRAIMSAKSSNLRTSSSTEGEFLHELEEKLEVYTRRVISFLPLSVPKRLHEATQIVIEFP